MKQKIYSLNTEEVEEEIDKIESSVSNEILEVKHDLLSVYLMNLILYNKLEEGQRTENPITEMLIKTSVLLEKICLMEKKADLVIKSTKQNEVPPVKYEEGKKRVITDEMMKNKFVTKKRKVEDRNPRLKYKNKAKKLAEKAEIKYDNNIDTKKTKTNKFG